MGGLCSTPEVNITQEQIESIKDLISNNQSFKNISNAVPFLVPLIAPTHKNDLENVFDAFCGDKRMLSSIEGKPDSLSDVNDSCESSLEKIVEAVCPLAEAALGDKLKEQLPDDTPETVKDKAVSVAVEKTVEKCVNEKVKALVDKQLKGEAPAAA